VGDGARFTHTVVTILSKWLPFASPWGHALSPMITVQKPRRWNSRPRLIHVFLKLCKDLAESVPACLIGGPASAMALWYLSEQRRELFLVEFMDADLHVLREHEVEKRLLLAVEVGG